jgi:hypothetical protein
MSRFVFLLHAAEIFQQHAAVGLRFYSGNPPSCFFLQANQSVFAVAATSCLLHVKRLLNVR